MRLRRSGMATSALTINTNNVSNSQSTCGCTTTVTEYRKPRPLRPRQGQVSDTQCQVKHVLTAVPALVHHPVLSLSLWLLQLPRLQYQILPQSRVPSRMTQRLTRPKSCTQVKIVQQGSPRRPHLSSSLIQLLVLRLLALSLQVKVSTMESTPLQSQLPPPQLAFHPQTHQLPHKQSHRL